MEGEINDYRWNKMLLNEQERVYEYSLFLQLFYKSSFPMKVFKMSGVTIHAFMKEPHEELE